ncbi:hypothetical protein [Burkholderia lata]|uniref:hypothetical protein n=1 Tax=Burkholderia lata (strain ATCC 17760 / DSM 23089 / LMG 22485 / NCIMB 9086 / R18194 / 383) TaxID=482957 RepID=UPI0012FD95A9|nr:hypothetical protein [Burkholderia lata]
MSFHFDLLHAREAEDSNFNPALLPVRNTELVLQDFPDSGALIGVIPTLEKLDAL